MSINEMLWMVSPTRMIKRLKMRGVRFKRLKMGDIKSHFKNLTFYQKNKFKKKTKKINKMENKIENKMENKIENEEYEFPCCNIEHNYNYEKNLTKVEIMVAGGGMSNGNAYATVEGHFKGTPDDILLRMVEDDTEWEYCEYGKNPCRVLLGNFIDFDDGGFNFTVYSTLDFARENYDRLRNEKIPVK